MPQFAAPIPAPALKKKAAPAAAKPQQRRSSPVRSAVIGQVVQRRAAESAAPEAAPKAPNRTGLPNRLKAGVERLSGLAMDDVRVHRNSEEPAKLGALAYTKGSEIHLGPGQEQHLPHEAWHVVQQKQGRVQATTQMKGVGINESAELEAEADRMGAAATIPSAAGGERRSPRGSGNNRQAVQKKVDLRGKALDKPKTASDLLMKYINADEPYVLRSDFAGHLEKTPIHLIDGRKYYLIGEEHNNSSTWETAITGWSHVPKMTEHERTMPKEPDDTKGVFVTPGTPKLKPLESTHSHLLVMALLSHDKLNNVAACFLKTGAGVIIQAKALIAILGSSIAYLNDLKHTFSWYARYIRLYKRKDITKTDRLTKIFDFSKLIEDKYWTLVSNLTSKLETLRDVIDFYWVDRKRVLINTSKSIDNSVAKIEKDREFLIVLAGTTLGIVNVANEGEAEAIRALFPSKVPDDAAVFGAVRPVRDREMASNVSRSPPPLIIRVGNAHVPGIASAVGSGVVVSVPLKGDRLEKKTVVAS